jgi:hypothetical protein
MAGSISTALIRASLAEVRGEVVSPLWRIEPLEVVGTTGSHRYDRWGEYFLTHYSSPDFGWSSPSCCEATPARLVFDAMRPYQFRRVGLTPRDWMLDSELRKSFPRRFDVKVSGDGDSWTTALAVDEYECDAPGIQYWPLDAVGRYISLEVREVGLRAELKFFSQVMKFEVWGDPPAPASPLGMARGRWDRLDRTPEGQSTKMGLFFSDDGCAVNVWHLPPDGELPARQILTGRAKMLVLDGAIEVYNSTTGEHLSLDRGGWAALFPGSTVRLRNPGDRAAAVLEMRSSPQGGEVWSSRS